MRFLFAVGLFITVASAQAATFDVGPKFPRKKLADVNWGSLKPGDVVNIHAKPGGYHEIIQISASGTAAKPIVIRGIPDPKTGALPIIDGKDAVMDPKVDFHDAANNGGHSVFENFGVIIVTVRGTGYVYGKTFPSYIHIETLDIRNALYQANGSISFTDNHGAKRIFDSFACGIYIEFAQHLVIRGCEISNNGNGIFANSKNLGEQNSLDLLIEKNYLHDNGQPVIPGLSDGYHEHNIYVESVGAVYQYNRFGPLRAGCHGCMIKDRSSGTVIRYNQVVSTETADIFAILDPQGGEGYIDQMPDYRDAYVYGNDITVEDSGSDTFDVVWFAAVNGVNSYNSQHRGTLYFYNNTVVSHHQTGSAFFLTDPAYTPTVNIFEKVDCRNNIFYTDTAIQNDLYRAFHFIITGGHTTVTLGTNWASPKTTPTWEGHESPATVIGFDNLIGNSAGGANAPGFVSLAVGDNHLVFSSQSVNAGGPLAGPAIARGFLPTSQYLSPQGRELRAVLGGAADLGAYEFDSSVPTVTIKGKAKRTVRRSVLVLHGTAHDEQAVARVEVRTGSHAFKPATGKAHWKYTLRNLRVGTTKVTVRAIDSDGKASTDAALLVTRKGKS